MARQEVPRAPRGFRDPNFRPLTFIDPISIRKMRLMILLTEKLASRIPRLPLAGSRKIIITATLGAAAMAVASVYVLTGKGPAAIENKVGLTKQKIASMLADYTSFYRFPTEIEIDLTDAGKTIAAPVAAPVPAPGHEGSSKKVRAVLEYAFDPRLQDYMESLYKQYKPDYGAFVAMDATTGQVLSLVSFSTKPGPIGNLALRATFPSASVFKVVTAAAAIETKNYSANTIIPFNGANHTLYRNNVMKNQVTRWTRYPTLKTAFANSINTVFGKLGALNMTPAELKSYADRFGFNKPIPADLPVQSGSAPVPEDPWERAETASGYTRDNTMSPLQGAMIAAAVVNDGVMMEPFIVRSVFTDEGKSIYKVEPKMAGVSVDARTAAEIRELMKETVIHGTSKKSFRGFFKHGKKYAALAQRIQVGGKTGSLTGMDPPGKYDWFVGYGSDGSRKIAVAALSVHEKFWKVKSSYLARMAIEKYFGEINAASSSNGMSASVDLQDGRAVASSSRQR